MLCRSRSPGDNAGDASIGHVELREAYSLHVVVELDRLAEFEQRDIVIDDIIVEILVLDHTAHGHQLLSAQERLVAVVAAYARARVQSHLRIRTLFN